MRYRLLILLFSVLFLNVASISSATDVTAPKAYKIIKNDKDIIILDVRTPDEWKDGHVKDSVLLDLRNESFDNDIKKLDKSKTYILYCRSGVRSAQAEEKLNAIGIKNTFNVKGGFIKWNEESLPIER